jgi:hypothetical protein
MPDQIYELDVLGEPLEEACVADKLFAAAYEGVSFGGYKDVWKLCSNVFPCFRNATWRASGFCKKQVDLACRGDIRALRRIDSDSKAVRQLTTLRCPVAQP